MKNYFMSKKILWYAIAWAVISFSSVSLAYFTDWLVDTSFLSWLWANGPVYTTTLLTDWKYLVWGAFSWYNGTATNRITRLNNNGTIDTSFNSGGQRANNIVRTTQQQSNGKYIIWGNFTWYDGVSINRIARLNTDWSLDTTFNPGSWLNTTVISTFLQSDDKVIIMWSFTNFSGTVRNRIARLNTDGTLDTTFNPGTLANATVYNLVQQPDTKYIVGGHFTTFNWTARTRIARITTWGVLDLTFGATTGANNYISSMALQPDGRIIVGWLFTWYNSLPINRIARLTSWWLLDTTFNSGGVGANELIWSVRLQSDGKILIWGAFTAYNWVPVSGIARLHPDGSLDTTFNPGWLWANSDVYRNGMILQSDGKILIWGNFSWYNGTWVGYITRLWYFTTGAITAPTKLSSGTITDTTFTITWTSNIYATWVTISGWSTANITWLNCIQTTALQVDCSLQVQTSWDVVVSYIDANGGLSTLLHTWYVIDNLPPVITINSPINNTQIESSSITVIFSGSDNVTWSILYECKVDTGSWSLCNSPYVVWWLWYGVHTVYIRWMDVVWNISAIASISVNYPAPIVWFWGGWGSAWTSTNNSSLTNEWNSTTNNQPTPTNPVEPVVVEPWVPSSIIWELYNWGIEDGRCYVRWSGSTVYQGNNVSMAFRKSHQMLYSYGLTKWKGTLDYRPEDTITREEAARFMVEYARNVLCREKVRVYENNFSDIQESDSTLESYLKLSYEYGIFKWSEGKFKPKDVISSDELSAVIVRMVTNEFKDERGLDWAQEYKKALDVYAKWSVINIMRSNIAEVMYDVYRNNEYERKPVWYVIK